MWLEGKLLAVKVVKYFRFSPASKSQNKDTIGIVVVV
jgi:hypothetical protein